MLALTPSSRREQLEPKLVSQSLPRFEVEDDESLTRSEQILMILFTMADVGKTGMVTKEQLLSAFREHPYVANALCTSADSALNDSPLSKDSLQPSPSSPIKKERFGGQQQEETSAYIRAATAAAPAADRIPANIEVRHKDDSEVRSAATAARGSSSVPLSSPSRPFPSSSPALSTPSVSKSVESHSPRQHYLQALLLRGQALLAASSPYALATQPRNYSPRRQGNDEAPSSRSQVTSLLPREEESVQKQYHGFRPEVRPLSEQLPQAAAIAQRAATIALNSNSIHNSAEEIYALDKAVTELIELRKRQLEAELALGKVMGRN